MSEPVVQLPTSMPIPQPQGSPLIALIDRAARDPSYPLDRLEKLLEMRDREEARVAETEFDAAMSVTQSKMVRVAADSNNPQTKSKYASYAALDRALRPIFTAEGFALSFNTARATNDGFIKVLCRVSHRTGYSREYEIEMAADGKGAKGGDVMTRTHATGSAVTYGMRYLLKMIFNVAIGEDDDDGNAASNQNLSGLINAEQVDTIKKLVDESGADLEKFLAYGKVDRIEDIPAKQFQGAVAILKKKLATKQAAGPAS